MNESLSRYRTEGLRIWQQLTPMQRVTLGLVGAGFVVALAFFAFLSQQVEYATVFSNLSQQDAAAVVAKLKETKIPYELSDGGTTVKVPNSQVHEVRLQLASEGLPQGSGVGFELFDKTSFGLTDFAQKLNYQRALEGELARTINQLSAVEQSRVHVVIPKPELYTENEKSATASVVISLRPGQELQGEQIRGICNLVAGSVEGLKPENVTIIDTHGNILSDAAVGSQIGQVTKATASQLEMQQSYQKNLEKSAQALLDQVLGHNKAAIRVHADLDWDQVESNSETFSPPGTVAQVRSSTETTERYTGNPGDWVGGIPGVSSNVPSYLGVESTITSTESISGTLMPAYERVDKTNNFELSKVVERTTKAPGTVKRLSVAVLLDNVVDDAQIQKVESLVSAAVGLDTTRGDAITVASMPFDRTYYEQQAQALDEAQRYSMYFDIGKIAVAIIALVVTLLFVRSLSRRLGSAKEAPTEQLPPPSVVTVTVPDLAELQQKRESARGQVSTLARTQPAAVAGLVKTWLREE